MRGAAGLALAAGLGATLASASAAAEPRCAVLGQMAVSSWLEMLGTLSRPEVAQADPVIARLDHLTATYARLGCEPAPLQAAFDCLLAAPGDIPPQDLARRCIAESGLAGE